LSLRGTHAEPKHASEKHAFPDAGCQRAPKVAIVFSVPQKLSRRTRLELEASHQPPQRDDRYRIAWSAWRSARQHIVDGFVLKPRIREGYRIMRGRGEEAKSRDEAIQALAQDPAASPARLTHAEAGAVGGRGKRAPDKINDKELYGTSAAYRIGHESAKLPVVTRHFRGRDGFVSRKFESARRRELLSFEHHRTVATLDCREQDWMLDRAQANHWSRAELRDEVRRHRFYPWQPAAWRFLGRSGADQQDRGFGFPLSGVSAEQRL
jgi:hypothetical protein